MNVLCLVFAVFIDQRKMKTFFAMVASSIKDTLHSLANIGRQEKLPTVLFHRDKQRNNRIGWRKVYILIPIIH